MIPDVAGSLDRDLAARWERLEARPDRWLSLAAAPTFAMMALLTWIHGGGMPDILCSAAQGASPLTGMVAMYSLMSAIHLAPWLRLLSRRRSRAGLSRSEPDRPRAVIASRRHDPGDCRTAPVECFSRLRPQRDSAEKMTCDHLP
jgi:hypothetical protein